MQTAECGTGRGRRGRTRHRADSGAVESPKPEFAPRQGTMRDVEGFSARTEEDDAELDGGV